MSHRSSCHTSSATVTSRSSRSSLGRTSSAPDTGVPSTSWTSLTPTTSSSPTTSRQMMEQDWCTRRRPSAQTISRVVGATGSPSSTRSIQTAPSLTRRQAECSSRSLTTYQPISTSGVSLCRNPYDTPILTAGDHTPPTRAVLVRQDDSRQGSTSGAKRADQLVPADH